MKINVREDLVKNLGKRYKVLLSVEGIVQYEFDEERNIIYSDDTATFYIKYKDSPLPTKVDAKLLFDMVVKDLTIA